MPKLSDILRQTLKTEVELVDGEKLEIEFRANWYTPEARSRIDDANTMAEQIDCQVGTLGDALVAWDFTDDDGKPVPVSADALRGLGINLLNAIFDAMLESIFPNRKRASS